MEILTGSCRFGLWFVHVAWKGDRVYRIRFATWGTGGPVPDPFVGYCAGQPVDLTRFSSTATEGDTVYARIYRAVQQIPYGDTATYGEIASEAGTSARVVGMAMARNPTPLVVPCHRVVAARGIGGFTPSVEIKQALLSMEKQAVARRRAH
jgi:methylated-DNA-[protein]-cysteine S-methyltransferase